ncbi:MAG TPA: 6-phosphogluconolactonase [Acidiferrobacter sp.]|nr:6-phosphogluconolactonase [Acidiferrobacter sp.]
MILTIANDPHALAQALADRLLLEARAAMAQDRPLRIALSGGSTPALFYEELARHSAVTPWSTLRIYFSDERAVPPDHPDSNFGLAQRLWLTKAPPDAHIYRIPGERGASEAAHYYEALLATQAAPVFDIVFLGLGPDGHIASLFPGTPLATQDRVVAVPATSTRSARISLSLATIVAARTRIVLTQGSAKAARLKQSLAADDEAPIATLLRQASVEFWLDQAAASALCAQLPNQHG